MNQSNYTGSNLMSKLLLKNRYTISNLLEKNVQYFFMALNVS